MGTLYPVIFFQISRIFTNLRCLKFNPSSSDDAIFFCMTSGLAIYSILLELHVSVTDMRECFDILDGRFDQLRILYVTFYRVSPRFFNIEHKVGYFY